MKSLSLSKPLVIIMVGLPGAGKSFFSRQFSEAFGAPVIHYERLRYELFGEPSYTKEEQDLVDRIAQYQLEETLKSKHTCIIDGTGYSRAERMTIRRTAKEAGYDSLVIWVQTDPATAKRRATHRNKQRLDDTYMPSLTADQYETFAKRLTPPNASEQYIVLSGKHTFATQLKAVLTRLTAPREEAEKILPPTRPQAAVNRPGGRRNILIH